MFAFSSGQVRAAAGGLSEAPPATPAQRRPVAAVIGHGLVIGAAATVLQLLLLFALLYASGVIGS